ncbi:short-chain dehydrogenase [Colletotrichum scovillei]|uniref:short-chain dehydrogenase n=1 Tax=Colletotrichum scovillei TaxID=1209932 RepID=UPI0015C3FECD|nr:short-chain dehydrogenase [Colletotrichum scovillei]KAF4772829.1 short-chain dehydrogenase [Colletotrichum scovillei]KAG7038475.1 short-chain dehydrogenase [Colletotrichum scovillei]
MARYVAAHQHPQGPGDSRPVALQIIQDEGLAGGGLSRKTALVTGANRGIGLETARALHAAGATVFLGVRDLKCGEEAMKDIIATSPTDGGAPILLLELSLDSLASVRNAAQTFLVKNSHKINILVLNAGVMACPKSSTIDGFETHFATNHLGHFLLFRLLQPALLASSSPSFNSRVVSVTSSLHRLSPIDFNDFNYNHLPYHGLRAYARSKTANVYLANEIERRFGDKGLHAISVHPGSVLTMISRHMEDDPLKMPEGDWEEIRYLKNAAQGAATSVLAAVGAEWEGRGGRYLADCVEQKLAVDPSSQTDTGYASWAFDEQAANRLWEESCRMTALEDGK